jgi:hypothetical protein
VSDPNRQLRDGVRRLVPPWLADRGAAFKNVAFSILWSIAAVLDALLELLVQGAQAHLPGLGTPTALNAEGRGRGIRRGPGQSDASYAAELQAWLETHKYAGHPFGVLRSIRAYLGPVRCRTVDDGGNWYTIDEDGTESHVHLPGSWDWGGTGWARGWVIVYAPADWEVWEAFWELEPDLYGGNLEGGNYTLGQQLGFDLVEEVRQRVRERKPAHLRVVEIILAFDPDSFDPADSDTCPDGNWLYFTKGSPKEPARFDTARYWAGVE